jgi:hypothetical protein
VAPGVPGGDRPDDSGVAHADGAQNVMIEADTPICGNLSIRNHCPFRITEAEPSGKRVLIIGAERAG